MAHPDGLQPPLCDCHGEPMGWQKDDRHLVGGYWHCIVRRREYARRYYHLYSESVKKKMLDYYYDNWDRVRSNQLQYYQKNRESLCKRSSRWRSENPETDQEYTRRRRAMLAGVLHEPYTRDEVFEKTQGVCYLCLTPLLPGWHVDHVIPISKGGPDILDNLMPACVSCNTSKGSRLLEEREGRVR